MIVLPRSILFFCHELRLHRTLGVMRARHRISLLFIACLWASCRGESNTAAPSTAAQELPSAGASEASSTDAEGDPAPVADALDSVELDPWPPIMGVAFPRSSGFPRLEREAERGLSEALIRVERAFAAPPEAESQHASMRARSSLERMRFEGVVTVIDDAGSFLFDSSGRTGDATRFDERPSLFAHMHALASGVRSGSVAPPEEPPGGDKPWAYAWITLPENGWLVCVRVSDRSSSD